MAATPKQELHELVERLTESEARTLSSVLQEGVRVPPLPSPRPLALGDIILTAAIMPEDERADDLIETVRRWRREGGNA